MEIFLTVVFIGFVIYWIWSDNEKSKKIYAEKERQERKVLDLIKKSEIEKMLIFSQFESYFKKLFSKYDLITKDQLKEIHKLQFSYYRDGEFETYLSDLLISEVVMKVKTESELFTKGKGFYERNRIFKNFEHLISNQYLEGFTVDSNGLKNNKSIIFHNDKFEIHYSFNFNLLSSVDFNKIWEEIKPKSESFFLCYYAKCFLYNISSKNRQSIIIDKEYIELSEDISVQEYKIKLQQWHDFFLV